MIKHPKTKKHLVGLVRINNPIEERESYLRLDKNENLIPFPQKFMDKVYKMITKQFISIYPELTGLYEKIADWIGCKTENIYVSAGSDAAIKSVFEVFVNPGDKILLLHPTYAMYYVYAHIFCGRLIKIEYDKNLSVSTEEVIKCIENEKPKLLCIANPNSPTGTIIPPAELERIVEAASKCLTVVLIDEAYYLYYNKSVVSLVNKYPNLIVTRTFSKALGLASARLGFAIGHKSIIASLHKVRPVYETNAYAVMLGKLVIENLNIIESNVRKTLEGKRFIEEQLLKMGHKFHKSHSNFIAIDVGSYDASKKIVDYMKKNKILIGGAYNHFSLENCIRVTMGTKEQMNKFLTKFKSYLKEQKG